MCSAKRVTFFEVKRQRDELDMKVLKDKVQRFMESTGMYGKYEVGVDGLCMEDMDILDYHRANRPDNND